jgi:hypothetical protein
LQLLPQSAHRRGDCPYNQREMAIRRTKQPIVSAPRNGTLMRFWCRSEPEPITGGFQNVGTGQTAASALGIQMAQLGQQYASRGLSIPPTLEVRPGYRFVIMVTKDMVLPGPWRG